ncbi:MAG: hypothetical protein FGM43_06440 [Sinobacteraceae bacterium]|nr:hypothetical protein [Nevskiaceae bacterium]
MTARKSFLLRMDPALYAQLERWAADEFRSVNGQVEFILRDALRKRGGEPAGHPANETRQDDDAI